MLYKLYNGYSFILVLVYLINSVCKRLNYLTKDEIRKYVTHYESGNAVSIFDKL